MTNPIIKWAGGKRQLLDILLPLVPKDIKTYYEPFFGGGALYFALQPEHAVLNDANRYLINLYRQIKEAPKDVMRILTNCQNAYNAQTSMDQRKEVYYGFRDAFNDCIRNEEESARCAALFLFLNKTCFNGVYRENSKGFFNVPCGRKEKLSAFEEDHILEVSKILENTRLTSGDYRAACRDAREGDFIFFDPPYDDTFSNYQKNGFNRHDQIELAGLFWQMTFQGVHCMLTNSNTDFIKELYKGFPLQVVSVKRMINRNANARTGEEVIITNY